ncbi:hypothetical protein D3Z51_12975 [Clostridiaceae bacterium]|nr:hypothetical protein [Clostridiaceae bacterium]RKI12051.1 hypothetical protein D7V81_12730 [bacterium 1XD21-70]
MSSRTKIVVLRMKEIIYTAIFIGLGILLVMLLFIMFRPGKGDDAPVSADQVLYIPGVYSASLKLGSQEVNVEVAVDADRITSISMVSLSDSVATMYPLVQPSLQNLTDQICQTQSTQNLTYPEESRYTSQVLLQAIEQALGKAAAK